MTEPIDGRPLAAQVYVLGTMLRKSATETYKNSLGLGSTEWPIVATLAAFGPVSLARLCNRLSRDKGQVSRDIATLVERQIVVKSRDIHDSRQMIISLDQENKTLMEEVKRIAEERHRLLTAKLSDFEKDMLFKLLATLYDNARHPDMMEV